MSSESSRPPDAEDRISHGDLLSVLLQATEARSARTTAEIVYNHLPDLTETFCKIIRTGREEAGREMLRPLVTCAVGEAQRTCVALRDDPAAPGLEDRYFLLSRELGFLAAVFASIQTQPRCVPNPTDAYAKEYRGAVAELSALNLAAAHARPTWRLLRASFLASLARPPARRVPTTPLADPQEYYVTDL